MYEELKKFEGNLEGKFKKFDENVGENFVEILRKFNIKMNGWVKVT